MQTRSRNTFTSIHTEGSLLPADLLQRVLSGDKDLGGLAPTDYHLPGNEKLNEAVNHSWNRLQGAWAAFQTSRSRLKEGDPGTTLTRERWLLPLFQELGYGRLVTTKAIEIEGTGDAKHRTYPISHGWANAPIHLVGCGIDLDRRAAGVAGASKSSPQSHAGRKTLFLGRQIMKDEYDFSKAKPGPVISLPAEKTRITIRLDEDVIDWFRQQTETQGGGNYQTMINQVLRDFVLSQREPLEETLRRVIREELQNYR